MFCFSNYYSFGKSNSAQNVWFFIFYDWNYNKKKKKNTLEIISFINYSGADPREVFMIPSPPSTNLIKIKSFVFIWKLI